MNDVRHKVAVHQRSMKWRRILHLKAVGQIAKRNPECAVQFVRNCAEQCVMHGVSFAEVLGWGKRREVVRVRETLLTWLHVWDVGFNTSAAALGMRNHSTAVLCVRRHREQTRERSHV